MAFFSTEIQPSLAATADRFRAVSSTELVASWKRTISAPIPSMSLARDSPEGFISASMPQSRMHIQIAQPLRSKIQQDPARHGKTRKDRKGSGAASWQHELGRTD